MVKASAGNVAEVTNDGLHPPLRYADRPPDRVELPRPFANVKAGARAVNDTDIPFSTKRFVMTGAGGHRPRRVRAPHVEWVRDRMSENDQKIVATVGLLKLTTSAQLERLHFFSLPSSHRSRTRRRVLKRLVEWRVLVELERRIGGVRAGSAGLVYALDSAGQWLSNQEARADGNELAVRRPSQPSRQLLAHTLGVAELFVCLKEQEFAGLLRVAMFHVEPACWWPNGLGGWQKPDAYLAVESGDVIDHWWLEHDEATESLPTIQRKLNAYLDFLRRGQRGPKGVTPRVLVSVPTEARRDAVAEVIASLPPPAHDLFRVVTHNKAAPLIGEVLRE